MQTEVIVEEKILSEVDQALREEAEVRVPNVDSDATQNFEQGTKLARLLRAVGSLVILAAAASFLVQRWGGLDHVMRYFSFLTFTIGLGGLGIFCGLKLQEDKSARTFLALAGSLVVVNFAQLAALIYSVFLGEQDFSRYPDFLRWQAPSIETLLLSVGVGLPVLALISAAAFTALAREIRTLLVAAFLALNIALLVPLRDPASTGIIALLMVVLLGVVLQKIKSASVIKTFEGRIVQLHLLLPIVIMIGRSAYLYDTTMMLVGLLSLSISVVLFSIIPQLIEDNNSKLLSQRLSIGSTAFGWYCVGSSLLDIFNAAPEFSIPFLIVPFAVALLVMSVCGVGDGKLERSLAAVTGVVAIILQVLIFPGVYTFSFALIASIVIMTYGFLSKEKAFFFCGIVGIAVSLLNHIKFAFVIGALNPWISLAILGTATIVAAAYAEKKFPQIVRKIANFKEQMASWK